MARISKRLVFSYIFDWIVIIAIAGAAGGLSFTSPYHRPFSLTDPEISYPYVSKEKISTPVLLAVCLIAPAAIILLISLLFVPGPTIPKGTPQSQLFRIKLWEWNTGWMGLALALAAAFFVTEGVKNLIGKPRPDLLSRCKPDLDLTSQAANTIGGVGRDVSNGIFLVSYTICQQKNPDILNDGFKSFFSGHSSFSFAGLTYLTLFICSKFAIGIPYLTPSSHLTHDPSFAWPESSSNHNKSHISTASPKTRSYPIPETPKSLLRRQAAAPPTYLLILAFFPVAVAIFISSTRYTDFRHRGFDIIVGSFVGILSAWLGFRWYHLPVRRGAGWSWGPRSETRAFGIGVGVLGYVEPEILKQKQINNDLELGEYSRRKSAAGQNKRVKSSLAN